MSSIATVQSGVSPTQSNSNNGFGQSLKALQSALQSGNVSSAQTAFASLLNYFPGLSQGSTTASTSSNGSGSTSSLNPVQTDLQTIQSALQSGNVGAAKSAFTKLTTDLQSAKGSGGTHHHHHGGGGGIKALADANSRSTSSTSNSTDSLATDLLSAVPATTKSTDASVVNLLG